jgi:hypothetical protein
MKRAFMFGEGGIFKLGTAMIRGPRLEYRFAFVAPAERFDEMERAFHHAVSTLHPLGPE